MLSRVLGNNPRRGILPLLILWLVLAGCASNSGTQADNAAAPSSLSPTAILASLPSPPLEITAAAALTPTPTGTATQPVTATRTQTPTTTLTRTPLPTVTPTSSPTPEATVTFTATPTARPTPVPTASPSPARAKAVVLIIIDGARWSETFGDPTHDLIPHLADDLAPMGAINTQFYNEATTLSLPGHAAIVTGTWQDIPNDGMARPTAPTIFEYFRRATGAPENEAVFVHGSYIEPVLTYSIQPAYGADFGARQFFSDEPVPPYDDGMWANAKQVLTELQPRLLMISLLDPDEAGHAGDWAAYRQAIRHDDEIIWDVWQQLQADPFYTGQTVLIVTDDHGRGCGEGWTNHGGTDECNRHIMFLAVGPDIRPGLVVEQRRTLRDIAPTIGYLLDFETPLADGEVMTELLVR